MKTSALARLAEAARASVTEGRREKVAAVEIASLQDAVDTLEAVGQDMGGFADLDSGLTPMGRRTAAELEKSAANIRKALVAFIARCNEMNKSE